MLEILLTYIIPLVIVIIGIDKNAILFGFIISAYNVLLNAGAVDATTLSLVILFIINFIATTIAFKLANKVEDSKFIYIVVWETIYYVIYLVLIGLLQMVI